MVSRGFRSSAGSADIDYEHGEYKKERKKYTGKTYDSVDSIAEFFKQRNRQLGQTAGILPTFKANTAVRLRL